MLGQIDKHTKRAGLFADTVTSGKSSFRLELNVNGDGMANKLTKNNDYAKDTWIDGRQSSSVKSKCTMFIGD